MHTHPHSVTFVFRDPTAFLAELTVGSRRLAQSPSGGGCVEVTLDCADPADVERARAVAARTGGVEEQARGRGPAFAGVATDRTPTVPIALLPEDLVQA